MATDTNVSTPAQGVEPKTSQERRRAKREAKRENPRPRTTAIVVEAGNLRFLKTMARVAGDDQLVTPHGEATRLAHMLREGMMRSSSRYHRLVKEREAYFAKARRDALERGLRQAEAADVRVVTREPVIVRDRTLRGNRDFDPVAVAKPKSFAERERERLAATIRIRPVISRAERSAVAAQIRASL